MSEFVDGHFHCRIDYAKRGGKKLSATGKFDYNNRLGRWAKKHEGPLGFSESGNMPAWAKEDPRKFWEAADQFERANGTFYYNAEFALPLDLATREQQLAVARDYVRQLIGDKHPYTLTMHDNKGNPHCDVMWSTSTLDGIERGDPQHFFKRADPKIAARGGCRKAYYDDNWIIAGRALWTSVANKHLEAAGSNVRIDHRSYKDRGIDKAPGVHLGQKAHRLEMAGKATWRGNKNRGSAHLNTSLQEVQSQIHQKENPNGKRHGRSGKPHAKQQHRAGVGGTAAAPKRAFAAWNDRGADCPGLRASKHLGPQRMPTLRQSRAGDGQQEPRDTVLQRPVSGHRDGNHRLHGVPVGGLYAVEALDRRQIYKAKLLQERYQQEIAAALAARLAYVDRQPDRIAITLKGGGQVDDCGDRLLTKSGRDQEILAAVALAKAKGWKTIHLTGSADFKARAWLEAARAGLQVTGYEPSPDLRAQLAQEKTMLGTPGGTSLTPDATLDTQANAVTHRWADALRQAKNRLEAARQSASALSLFEYDQQRKKVAAWLDEVERRGVTDDLLWQIGHHQVGDGKKAPDAAKAALEPLYQLRQGEIDGRKQAAELARQEQIQRELMAQSKADELNDLMTQPGLSAAQVGQLQQEHRYYTALAAGYDEAEARERSANPNAAPRPI
jgi:hypothetical protein